jgi:hypothetical protein
MFTEAVGVIWRVIRRSGCMAGTGWIAPTPEEVTTGLAFRDCAQSREVNAAQPLHLIALQGESRAKV